VTRASVQLERAHVPEPASRAAQRRGERRDVAVGDAQVEARVRYFDTPRPTNQETPGLPGGLSTTVVARLDSNPARFNGR